MFIKQKLYYLTLTCIFAYSKTIRSKIYTNENGTKELVFSNNSEVEQRDIDFLLKDLNMTSESFRVRSQEVEEPKRKESDEKLNESILIKHWNALTEVGWKNFTVKKMLINDTRVLRLDPECEKEETTERKPRKEDEEPSATDFDLCQAVIDLCRPQAERRALLACLTSKNETLLHMLEERWALRGNSSACLPEDSALEESPRTLIRPRRLLHKVLLPLLVIMVIKYLVTLPFVAVSVFTLNAMWLGLLSLGAVVFSKFKGHDHYYHKAPHRRLHGVHGGEVFDPFSAPDILWSPVRVPLGEPSPSGH